MDISKLYWHDGIITGFEFHPKYDGTSKISLSVELFSDHENTEYHNALKVCCSDVRRFITTCDIWELNDNNCGNILDGWVTGNVLRVSLFGGYIEVEAQKFMIEH